MIGGVLNELDLGILRALPDEGTKLGKYLPNALTSKGLQRALDDEYVSSMMVGRALAELKKADLVVAVPSQMGGRAAKSWQRTSAGKKQLHKQGGEEDST